MSYEVMAYEKARHDYFDVETELDALTATEGCRNRFGAQSLHRRHERVALVGADRSSAGEGPQRAAGAARHVGGGSGGHAVGP